jgi:hypothetical protein
MDAWAPSPRARVSAPKWVNGAGVLTRNCCCRSLSWLARACGARSASWARSRILSRYPAILTGRLRPPFVTVPSMIEDETHL